MVAPDPDARLRRLILEAIGRKAVRTVIELSSGLDTRPYRLALPANVRWIELDVPGLVVWKDGALAGEQPSCGVERLPLELADAGARRALFARLAEGGSRVLVVTEGLLSDLDEGTVAALSADLREHFPRALWALETLSPAVRTRLQRDWDKASRSAAGALGFAPSEGLGFFEARGFAPLVTKSLLDEAERLGRGLRPGTLLRGLARLWPPLRAAHARRQQRLREAVSCALLEARG